MRLGAAVGCGLRSAPSAVAPEAALQSVSAHCLQEDPKDPKSHRALQVEQFGRQRGVGFAVVVW
jgi:hypothetical protein